MDQTNNTPVENDTSHTSPHVSRTAAKPSNGKLFMIGGVIIAVAGIGAYVLPHGSPANADASTGNTSAVSYKDGTYSANGSYRTHAGPEQVQVTLTLKNNIVTDSQFSATPNAQMSARYQGMFAANYKPMVVGKNINDIHLGKVSGSSLTPIGFNDALAKIKAQAARS